MLLCLWKKFAPNTFPKHKINRHLQHFWVISFYPKTNDIFNICAYFGFTLYSALQSHLKEVLISNVSFSNFHFHWYFHFHFHYNYLFDHRFMTHSNKFRTTVWFWNWNWGWVWSWISLPLPNLFKAYYVNQKSRNTD